MEHLIYHAGLTFAFQFQQLNHNSPALLSWNIIDKSKDSDERAGVTSWVDSY